MAYGKCIKPVALHLLLLCSRAFATNLIKHKVVIAIVQDNSSDWNLTKIDEFLSVVGLSSEFEAVIKLISLAAKETELSHFAVREVIRILEEDEISVLIGPYNPAIHLAIEEKGLPYLVTTDGSVDEIQRQQFQISRHFLLPMVPPPSILSSAILDLANSYGWEDITIIYDMQKGFQLLASIVSSPPHNVRGWKLSHQMSDEDIKNQLLRVRQMNLRHIVVACESSLLERIFDLALKLSMMSENYFWIIADLNPFIVDFGPYRDTRVNLTLFQYFDRSRIGSEQILSTKSLVHDLLLVDSLTIVKEALVEHIKTFDTQLYSSITIRPSGTEFVKILKQNNVIGATGKIKFDLETGTRTDFQLQIMALNSSGLVKIGEWQDRNEGHRLNLTLSKWIGNSTPPSISKSRFRTEVVKIVTVLDPPFVMCKQSEDMCNPNNTTKHDLEGFLIDMIEEISIHPLMKFNYELYLSPDGNYGSKNEHGNWNGMIRELMIGEATMCLGAISITAVREEAVDFTKPFKQKQFNLLMKKPTVTTSPYQFLWPLSWEVWALTLMAMVVVGTLLFVMDRITPNSKHSEERFDLHESLFFIYGTLVGPGTEMVPRTISGRILSMAWWFFGMILVSSYTANLAAFLTVTKIETPVKSVADLASQSKIKYGTVKNTYAMSMFRNSEVEIYKKMWEFMKNIHPDSIVANTTEGISKVLTEEYAFIWDQPINDYIATRNCDVVSTGEPFDEKGYGIGVPIGAAYRDDVTMVILELQEKGRIKRLEDKWWSSGRCPAFKDTVTVSKELKVNNVLGIFFVLAAGAGVSFLVCFLEFVILKLRQHRQHMSEAVKLSAISDNGIGDAQIIVAKE